MKYSSKSQAENGIDNTTIMTPLRVKQSILVNSYTAPTQLQADWNETDSTKLSYIKNKPTIPTVNNGTLTIQKNGNNVQTFSANQSTNATANITVPTKTSDLTNDSGYITGYTETDPIFSSSPAAGITNANITQWNAAEQNVQADWNVTSSSSDAYIKNKPKIPTKTSDLTNDSGFLTTETDPVFSASAASGITSSNISYWTGKQDALVSGINIKTINSQSILGSGNIDISSGGGGTGGTTDYDELVNHPKINGVELVGDKSTDELGIDIPTKISDLENDGYLVTVKTGERRWATYAQG